MPFQVKDKMKKGMGKMPIKKDIMPMGPMKGKDMPMKGPMGPMHEEMYGKVKKGKK